MTPEEAYDSFINAIQKHKKEDDSKTIPIIPKPLPNLVLSAQPIDSSTSMVTILLVVVIVFVVIAVSVVVGILYRRCQRQEKFEDQIIQEQQSRQKEEPGVDNMAMEI